MTDLVPLKGAVEGVGIGQKTENSDDEIWLASLPACQLASLLTCPFVRLKADQLAGLFACQPVRFPGCQSGRNDRFFFGALPMEYYSITTLLRRKLPAVFSFLI